MASTPNVVQVCEIIVIWVHATIEWSVSLPVDQSVDQVSVGYRRCGFIHQLKLSQNLRRPIEAFDFRRLGFQIVLLDMATGDQSEK